MHGFSVNENVYKVKLNILPTRIQMNADDADNIDKIFVIWVDLRSVCFRFSCF